MANLYVSSKYKNQIITLLLENPDFIKLINPVSGKCEDYVFDYNFVEDTTTQENTFLFVETDITSIRQNIFTDFNLYIYIFTSKNLVRLTENSVPTTEQVRDMGYFSGTYGNRIDILCDIVDRILNGTDQLKGIGDLHPSETEHMTMYNPGTKYYGKCLKYQITNFNNSGDNNED